MEWDSIKHTEILARIALHNDGPELMQEYPILKIAFDEDGHKKDIVTLLNERKKLLETRTDTGVVNELYGCILDETVILGESQDIDNAIDLPTEVIGQTIQNEQLALEQYIIDNPKDSFVYNLLISRMQRQGIESSQIQAHISELEQRREVNQTRTETVQQKEPEQAESIKDEVGDNFQEQENPNKKKMKKLCG